MTNIPNADNGEKSKLSKMRSQLAFTPFERKALWILSFLLISGTSFRMYQNHQINNTLELIPISKLNTQTGDEMQLSEPKETVFPLNINKAIQTDLELLPGIGPVKALAIIDHIRANGRFQDIKDILKVKGIGPSTLKKIENFIVTEP